MSLIDHTRREIHSRVLYLGAEHAGKATNLDDLYRRTSGDAESPSRSSPN